MKDKSECECQSCGFIFDINNSEIENIKCPMCGGAGELTMQLFKKKNDIKQD